MSLERACEILNERGFRERRDWEVSPYWMDRPDMPHEKDCLRLDQSEDDCLYRYEAIAVAEKLEREAATRRPMGMVDLKTFIAGVEAVCRENIRIRRSYETASSEPTPSLSSRVAALESQVAELKKHDPEGGR